MEIAFETFSFFGRIASYRMVQILEAVIVFEHLKNNLTESKTYFLSIYGV
jgi:hypothetical protein